MKAMFAHFFKIFPEKTPLLDVSSPNDLAPNLLSIQAGLIKMPFFCCFPVLSKIVIFQIKMALSQKMPLQFAQSLIVSVTSL